MAKKPNQSNMTFRQKVARVYGRGSDAAAPVNPSIDVDRHFTLTFSEEEREKLENEQRQVGERLAAGMRR